MEFASESASRKLEGILKDNFGSFLLSSNINLGDLVVQVSPDKLKDFITILKIDSSLKFNFLVDITAIDWLDAKADRFEVVYHLLSLESNNRLRIKVALPESNPVVDTITSVYRGADFQEREVWDMYGITFKGHPDLRRILMYDEFVGHPLRKDYPVQGKQPRVELRSPEVHNTARDMNRSPLVQISKKKAA